MKYYVKEYPDGVEYSPVGSEVDQKKLDAGFIIVDEIPQRIRDKELGGKDYVEPKSMLEQKMEHFEQRLADLEARKIS